MNSSATTPVDQAMIGYWLIESLACGNPYLTAFLAEVHTLRNQAQQEQEQIYELTRLRQRVHKLEQMLSELNNARHTERQQWSQWTLDEEQLTDIGLTYRQINKALRLDGERAHYEVGAGHDDADPLEDLGGHDGA